MAAIACAWFRKNVFQPCDGDPPCTMYFETVDWATSKPSINSSPWTRDAPHFGFSLLICRMRSRNSRSIFGRPARFRDFQRQNAVKPARCQRWCTPQGDAKLMAKEQVLRFKSARRLEKVNDEHCERMQEREHRPRSCDDSTRRCDSQAGRDFRKGQVTSRARTSISCIAMRMVNMSFC